MSDSAFVLGNGFSHAFNPKEIPLDMGFLKVAVDRNKFIPDDEHKELNAYIKRYFRPNYSLVSLESVTSFLRSKSVPNRFDRTGHKEELYSQLISIVEFTLCTAHKTSDKKDLFQAFANKLVADKTNVLTFNYDLILDNLLRITKKWFSADGYGVRFDVAGFHEFPFKQAELSESAIRYYKLHGSLNWGKRIIPLPDGRDGVYISPGELMKGEGFEIQPIRSLTSAGGASMANFYYDTFIVPPVPNKDYDSPLLQNVWYSAREALSTTKNIYILGYSFPRTDFLLNHFLGKLVVYRGILDTKEEILSW